jgi:mycothiol synthase
MTLSALRPPAPAAFMRPFRDDADWWAIRDLLVRTQADTPLDWNWDIRHWDGSRSRPDQLHVSPIVRNGIGLWEADGRLVGVAHSEDGGDAFFELDPAFCHLLPAMLAWAEESLAGELDDRRVLNVHSWDFDLVRERAYAQRGYTRTDAGSWLRIVRFWGARVPDERVSAPYVLRTTTDATMENDAARMARLFNSDFGRTFHTADQYLRFATMSPSFSHELNLVAEAPDGHFAAHVGVTFDPVNRHGIFEPVATDPRDQRHGLARALIREGMRRLIDLGATNTCVETGDTIPANALYRACGFTEEYRGHWWKREL